MTAAAETQRLTIAAHTSEADAAAAWCANGGAIALAGAAGVAAFQAAAQPIFDQIKQDSLSATLITDIQKLKASTSPAPGAMACGTTAIASPPPSASDALTGSWHTDKLLKGPFEKAFVAAGGSETEAHDFFAQLGGGAKDYAVIGMRFVNGIFTEFESGDGKTEVPGAHATYAVSADGAITLTDSGDGSKGHFATTLSGDELQLRALDICPADCHPYGQTLFASFPYHRDPSPLEGTWHTGQLTEDQIVKAFVAAGGTESEGHSFFSSLGDSAKQDAVLGMRFDNGIFTEFQSGDGRPDVPGYHATYSMTPDGLLTIASTDGGCTGTYRVSIGGDELDLRAKDQCAGHDSVYNTTLFSSFPFHKDGL